MNAESDGCATSAAIFQAVMQDDVGLLAELLDGGAELNAQNDAGFTPIALAIERGKPRTLEFLAAHGPGYLRARYTSSYQPETPGSWSSSSGMGAAASSCGVAGGADAAAARALRRRGGRLLVGKARRCSPCPETPPPLRLLWGHATHFTDLAAELLLSAKKERSLS